MAPTWTSASLSNEPNDLGNHCFDHVARDVRQTVVTSLELEGLPLVVDAEEVLHRGMQVVHVDRVLDDVVAELVGLTVDMAAFDAMDYPDRNYRKCTPGKSSGHSCDGE